MHEREKRRTYYTFFIFFSLVANSNYDIKTQENASDRSISNYRCLITVLCFHTFQHTFISASFTKSVSFEKWRNIPSPDLIIFILRSYQR